MERKMKTEKKSLTFSQRGSCSCMFLGRPVMVPALEI